MPSRRSTRSARTRVASRSSTRRPTSSSSTICSSRCPKSCATLDQSRVEISPGERIQILGKAASGKTTLFRALAGMWPWGGGTLRLPPREAMTFMPQRPYLPFGTLRAAVCYPAEPGHFDEAAVVAALERVDLGHLVPSLDRTERWDRQLPLDEQQRLAFARLLLHAPRWVVLDDAISALGDLHRRLVLSLCDRELLGVTLIRLGRDSVLDGFWNRTLHIIERPGGPAARRPAARRRCGRRFAHRSKLEAASLEKPTPLPSRDRARGEAGGRALQGGAEDVLQPERTSGRRKTSSRRVSSSRDLVAPPNSIATPSARPGGFRWRNASVLGQSRAGYVV